MRSISIRSRLFFTRFFKPDLSQLRPFERRMFSEEEGIKRSDIYDGQRKHEIWSKRNDGQRIQLCSLLRILMRGGTYLRFSLWKKYLSPSERKHSQKRIEYVRSCTRTSYIRKVLCSCLVANRSPTFFLSLAQSFRILHLPFNVCSNIVRDPRKPVRS